MSVGCCGAIFLVIAGSEYIQKEIPVPVLYEGVLAKTK